MMKIRDLTRHEVIGLNVEVIESENQCLVGIKGKIVDETKNTISIKKNKKIKKILKNQIKLMIKMNKQKIKIDGKFLIGRSEDRIKK